MSGAARADHCAERTLAWFAVAWSFATFFHIRLGHLRPWEYRPLEAGLMLAALTLLVLPRSRSILALTCVLQLLDYGSVPQLSNHYTLQAFCSVAILLSLAATVISSASTAELLRSLRLSFSGLLAVLYFWSGAHKLNSAFFDPSVSCATALLADVPGSAALDGMAGVLVALLVVGLELLAAGLLVLGRGASILWLLAPFHLAIGWTGYAYYLDFSSLVFACWLLLVGAPGGPDASAVSQETGVTFSRWSRRRVWWVPLLVAVLLGLPSWIRVLVADPPRVVADDRVLWVLFGLPLTVLLIARSRKAERAPPDAPLRRGRVAEWSGRFGVLLVSCMFLLGLSPYLGLRTEATFSMFSNLQTEDGWNHLVLPEAIRVASFQEPVRILESDLPRLEWWVQRSDELAPTSFAFRRILGSSGEGRVRYEVGGRESVYDGATDRPARSVFAPLLNRLLVFKPVVLEEPRPCSH